MVNGTLRKVLLCSGLTLSILVALFVIVVIADTIAANNMPEFKSVEFEDIEWGDAKRIGTEEWEAEWDKKMATFMEPTVPSSTKTMPMEPVRRYGWGSSAEERAELWNIPVEESREATATAFLRICVSEASGNQADCLGIWQVVNTIRSHNCNREVFPNITECNENGETYLSAMRRVSKRILGVAPPKTRRQRWIAELGLDCNPPPMWPHSGKRWENGYRSVCEDTVKLAYDMADGKRNYRWPIRYAKPVAWGGRCESGRGACDDRIACSRGLARLHTTTLNAFWCKPGTPGCRRDIDPICIKLGFGPRRAQAGMSI